MRTAITNIAARARTGCACARHAIAATTTNTDSLKRAGVGPRLRSLRTLALKSDDVALGGLAQPIDRADERCVRLCVHGFGAYVVEAADKHAVWVGSQRASRRFVHRIHDLNSLKKTRVLSPDVVPGGCRAAPWFQPDATRCPDEHGEAYHNDAQHEGDPECVLVAIHHGRASYPEMPRGVQ